MQHNEMIEYSHFGLISRTCLVSLIAIVGVFALI